ncbi:putative leucine-rich repeat domain superfamily [Helianthus annuus]|nr:putative leucine-rich repeat domain superfamily [Helianthus annuus]
MPHLVELILGNNHIYGNLVSIPPTLHMLDLSNNYFGGKLPSLTNGSALTYLDLSGNYFVGSLHNLVCSNGVNTIELVELGNNQLSGVIPECWEKWSSLKVLLLGDNNLSGEIPRTLGSVPLLQLVSFDLGRNNLAGIIPPWIGIKLTVLKILNLRSNNFYGITPDQLCYLSQVQVLDLADNNLSGNIPRCFNNFSVLSGIETNLEVQLSFYLDGGSFIVGDSLVMKGQEAEYGSFLGLVMLLDLSSNKFSGQIPSELTTLHKLNSLNLSRNQLTGEIPNKIGDMKSLESLDLSVNNLSGELPMSLSELNFLGTLNVSYNNLIGRVPTGTQIQSFNESSFIGNKLCGAPLTNDCVHIDKPDTTGDQKKAGGSHKVDWGLIISIVLGFITGFWAIVVPLILNRSWRITYFRLLRKLIKV